MGGGGDKQINCTQTTEKCIKIKNGETGVIFIHIGQLHSLVNGVLLNA